MFYTSSAGENHWSCLGWDLTHNHQISRPASAQPTKLPRQLNWLCKKNCRHDIIHTCTVLHVTMMYMHMHCTVCYTVCYKPHSLDQKTCNCKAREALHKSCGRCQYMYPCIVASEVVSRCSYCSHKNPQDGYSYSYRISPVLATSRLDGYILLVDWKGL